MRGWETSSTEKTVEMSHKSFRGDRSDGLSSASILFAAALVSFEQRFFISASPASGMRSRNAIQLSE